MREGGVGKVVCGGCWLFGGGLPSLLRTEIVIDSLRRISLKRYSQHIG